MPPHSLTILHTFPGGVVAEVAAHGKGEWSNGRTRRASLIEFKNNMAQELQPMQAPRRAVQFASDAHAGTGNTYADMAPQRTRAKTSLT